LDGLDPAPTRRDVDAKETCWPHGLQHRDDQVPLDKKCRGHAGKTEANHYSITSAFVTNVDQQRSASRITRGSDSSAPRLPQPITQESLFLFTMSHWEDEREIRSPQAISQSLK